MYAEFFMQNWVLFLALAAVLGLMVLDPGGASRSSARGVSPMELSRLVNHEQAVIVDVRTKEEYDAGHIAKSRNLSLDQLDKKSKLLEKFKKRPMVLVCQNGNQAAKAATVLRKLEFDKLFHLTGGIAEWRKESLPLDRSKANKSKPAKISSDKSISDKSDSDKPNTDNKSASA